MMSILLPLLLLLFIIILMMMMMMMMIMMMMVMMMMLVVMMMTTITISRMVSMVTNVKNLNDCDSVVNGRGMMTTLMMMMTN